MEYQEIVDQATSYINQSFAGLEVENPKIDFKTNWYKLNEPRGINEFIKDTSAVANSFGPDGLIIIGYDDKSKTFSNACFEDSGLRDSSQLPDLINKKVDRLFHLNLIEAEISGHRIAILHIPPSIDKPHVIRNYQTFEKGTSNIKSSEDHKIFIRRGSSTYPASKSDLELMYYDRKNIVPEYRVLATLPLTSVRLNLTPYTNGAFTLGGFINLILENVGRRPISVCGLMVEFSVFIDPSDFERIEFNALDSYLGNPIIVQSGQLVNAAFEITTHMHPNPTKLSSRLKDFVESPKEIKIMNYMLKLSNGEKINGPIQTIFK
ncbi:MAG: ATP-binding protein [Janthinobacterium sp.]|jgi:hypothetical protein